MPKKLTTSEFIARAKELYEDKYDYSNVVYKDARTKVCVICPKHGEFWLTPGNFLRGQKCPTCSREAQKSTKEEFIRKAREIYGKTYDYSKVEYTGNKNKVCIICPEHGEFWMSPNNHLRGHRCPGCFGTPKHTTEEFVTKAIQVHGDKYDYSKVEYDGLRRRVCIICPDHGEFWISAASHLEGHGCPYCSGMAKVDERTFLERCTERHHGKYDYSQVHFKRMEDYVKIICPEHGEFWQRAKVHYRGYGCPICGGSKRLTNEEFVEKAKLVHEDKYDYSKVNYINTATKVCIICPEHGEFWQTPNNHLFGAGCPTCPESNMEGEIRQFLLANNIVFEQEKSFDWLVYNRRMFLDFFLPEYGVAIECQGGQHFAPTQLFGGEEFYKQTIERDAAKKKLCEEHGINILYFSHAHIDYPYPVFESMRLLLKAIKNRGIITDKSQWCDPELPLEFE